ncbi:MAG TPA: TIGR03560 family F420-dependent LLM class oxidoreductase [Candidatus Limnocylindrales bacterium]
MRIGIIAPQGWTGEYAGWAPADAWRRTVEIAQRADDLGFESIWLYDHFHTTPEPTDELTFECFTSLAALAALTRRASLGQIVTCASYRNPALLAKMVATMDSISGGRMELGLGGGWKRDEWEAYGYPFPSTRERLAVLEETLEVVRRMLGPGRATWHGEHVRVDDAINQPKPIQQPTIPIIVGGNGRDVTWRIAARLADEINVDSMPADELRDEAMPIIRRRCEEIGRDPATLRVSAHVWWEHLERAPDRAAHLAAYRDAGASRVITMIRSAVQDPAALDRFREDALAAGAELGDLAGETVAATPSTPRVPAPIPS